MPGWASLVINSAALWTTNKFKQTVFFSSHWTTAHLSNVPIHHCKHYLDWSTRLSIKNQNAIFCEFKPRRMMHWCKVEWNKNENISEVNVNLNWNMTPLWSMSLFNGQQVPSTYISTSQATANNQYTILNQSGQALSMSTELHRSESAVTQLATG